MLEACHQPDMIEKVAYFCTAAVVALATFQYVRIVALALNNR